MIRSWQSRIVLTIACFFIGALIAAQWRTSARVASSPVRVSSAEQAVVMSSLVESNAKLRGEIDELQRQLRAFQENNRQSALEKLVDELTQLKIVNGLIGVSGPGLELRFTGNLSVYDIQDILNELRNAGAEAIALNDQRLIGMSVIKEQGQRIIADGVTLTSPYVFQAIGDPVTLENASLRKGGIIDLLKRAYADLDVTAEQRQNITLPVYRRAYRFNYAAIVR